MEETILIPESRIGALIGSKGKTKKEIISKTGVMIEIDSTSGEVFVSGEGENYFKAINIVKAIGRGFSPEKAMLLLKDDYYLRILDIADYVGKNSSKQKARRGRVIGREGSARKMIERKTKCFISVQGKTVAIIGKLDKIEDGIRAVELLLLGAKHETAERFLEQKHNDEFNL